MLTSLGLAKDGVPYLPAFHVCYYCRQIALIGANQIYQCETDLTTFQQLHLAASSLEIAPNCIPYIHVYSQKSFEDSTGEQLQDALGQFSIVVCDAFQPDHLFDEEGLTATVGHHDELILLGENGLTQI